MGNPSSIDDIVMMFAAINNLLRSQRTTLILTMQTATAVLL